MSRIPRAPITQTPIPAENPARSSVDPSPIRRPSPTFLKCSFDRVESTKVSSDGETEYLLQATSNSVSMDASSLAMPSFDSMFPSTCEEEGAERDSASEARTPRLILATPGDPPLCDTPISQMGSFRPVETPPIPTNSRSGGRRITVKKHREPLREGGQPSEREEAQDLVAIPIPPSTEQRTSHQQHDSKKQPTNADQSSIRKKSLTSNNVHTPYRRLSQQGRKDPPPPAGPEEDEPHKEPLRRRSTPRCSAAMDDDDNEDDEEEGPLPTRRRSCVSRNRHSTTEQPHHHKQPKPTTPSKKPTTTQQCEFNNKIESNSKKLVPSPPSRGRAIPRPTQQQQDAEKQHQRGSNVQKEEPSPTPVVGGGGQGERGDKTKTTHPSSSKLPLIQTGRNKKR